MFPFYLKCDQSLLMSSWWKHEINILLLFFKSVHKRVSIFTTYFDFSAPWKQSKKPDLSRSKHLLCWTAFTVAPELQQVSGAHGQWNSAVPNFWDDLKETCEFGCTWLFVHRHFLLLWKYYIGYQKEIRWNILNVCDVVQEIVQRYRTFGKFDCFFPLSQSEELMAAFGQTFFYVFGAVWRYVKQSLGCLGSIIECLRGHDYVIWSHRHPGIEQN